MKRLVLSGLLLACLEAQAYGMAFFTGRMEYIGINTLLCEYQSTGRAFTVMISGTYCPATIDL